MVLNILNSYTIKLHSILGKLNGRRRRTNSIVSQTEVRGSFCVQVSQGIIIQNASKFSSLTCTTNRHIALQGTLEFILRHIMVTLTLPNKMTVLKNHQHCGSNLLEINTPFWMHFKIIFVLKSRCWTIIDESRIELMNAPIVNVTAAVQYLN
jgi:hypothetical protein